MLSFSSFFTPKSLKPAPSSEGAGFKNSRDSFGLDHRAPRSVCGAKAKEAKSEAGFLHCAGNRPAWRGCLILCLWRTIQHIVPRILFLSQAGIICELA
jgi:hypothetical protein